MRCNGICKRQKLFPIFQTKYIKIRSENDVTYFLRQSMIDIKSRIGKFTKQIDTKEGTDQVIMGTDCVDSGIDYEKLNIVKIQNVFANGFIELPERIKNTKSCINIKHQYNKCFLYCHLLHERYRLCDNVKNADRLHGKKACICDDKMINLDYEGIEFPIPYNDFYYVKKIEDQNKRRINIVEYKPGKKQDILPIYHSKKTYEKCINLLVISDNNNKNYHYVYIKSLNRLLSPLTKHVGTNFCEDCFKQFSSKKTFDSVNHKCNYKNNLDGLPENMMIKDNKLLTCPLNSYVKPFNLKHKQCLLWVMYCDFESLLISIKDEKHPDKYEHKLSSYCYNLVCRERPSFNRFKLYRGNENDSIYVIDNFFNDIKDVLSHIQNCKKRYYKLPMLTDEQLKTTIQRRIVNIAILNLTMKILKFNIIIILQAILLQQRANHVTVK